jgi:pimeloyl-ACP methyl ester carboxylesterase
MAWVPAERLPQGLAPAVYFREAGAGPGVLCLHANASTSGQWRGLMERLAPRWHVLAPDLLGAGQGAPWPTDRVVALQDEVDHLQPVLAQAGEPCVLVGHSYGGAVALRAAVQQPQRVRALALYEPTLFALIDAQSPPPNDADGIRAAVAAAGAALDAGDEHEAARCFIDYWMGPGAFAATPPARQAPIAAAVRHVRGWAHALLTEPTPLAALAQLSMPVLLMVGDESPASSRGVARSLAAVLPQVRVQTFPGLGHMGPVTHADVVNEAITAFLDTL